MPQVGDVYQLLTLKATTVNESATHHEVVKAMLSGSPMARSVYVVDDTGRLRGIITMNHIMKGIAVQRGLAARNLVFKSPFELFRFTQFSTAKDMMRPPVYVTRSTRLQEALGKMVQKSINELPVVDKDGKVIGDLNAYELLSFV